MEALGIYLANMVLLNRLSAALRPQMGLQLENETRQLISAIFELQQKAAVNHPRASICLAIKGSVAKATIDTELEWSYAYSEVVDNMMAPLHPIQWSIFERWTRLKGYKMGMADKE